MHGVGDLGGLDGGVDVELVGEDEREGKRSLECFHFCRHELFVIMA